MLRAIVLAAGLVPVEDPSNSDIHYERVRWRQAMPALASLGLDAAALARIPDGGKLVLLSRAEVVDYVALQAELQTGRIEAAIDVFPVEPVVADDALRGLDAAILSSHRAGGLAQTLLDIGEMAVDDLELVLRGLPPVRLQMAQPETVGLQRSKSGLPAC